MRLRQHLAVLLVMSLLSSTVQAHNERWNALTVRLLQWAVGTLPVGFWKLYVDHFDPQHIADIEKICGEEALSSAFDEGYIIDAREDCIRRLQEKGWVVAAQPLPK